MPGYKGRDLLLKIGDGEVEEEFMTIGAVRVVGMTLNNSLADVTALDSEGYQGVTAEGGVQSLAVSLEGLFKDSVAEENLRASAFGRTTDNYQLSFPNGDVYAAAFVVHDYRRGGSVDGMENFTVTLVRSGGGTFTPGA